MPPLLQVTYPAELAVLQHVSHSDIVPAPCLTPSFANPCCAKVTYPAELAGLHYGVRSTVAGLLITVYGYSDTLATLAQV